MDIGILKSANESIYPNVVLKEGKLIFGRNPKCDVLLKDIRCSGIHCEITCEYDDEYFFIIKDLSSNGTYLNGKIIGKNNQVKGKWDDILDILPPSKLVNINSSISYTFIKTKKRKNGESHTESSVKATEDFMEDEITCSICFEIICEPVSLYPCLHNFCEACYLDWKTRSVDCPSCRAPVSDHIKNPQIQALIAIFISSNPSKSKIIEKCQQCDVNPTDFQCPITQKHIKCTKCSVFMPKRDSCSQFCSICGKAYCSLYFYNCKGSLMTFSSYCDKPAFVPPGCLNNKVEENIVSDYFTLNRMKSADVCERIKKDDVLRFEGNSAICENCIGGAWTEVIERFRVVINGELPDFIRNRPVCGKGRACVLQNSVIHAQLFSHFN